MSHTRRRLLFIALFVMALVFTIPAVLVLKRLLPKDETTGKWVHIKRYAQEQPDAGPNDFIQLKDNRFLLKGERFFLVLLNYVPEFRFIEDRLFLGPVMAYEHVDRFETHTLDSARLQLAGHFQLIKSLGFNSLRIPLDRVGKDDTGFYYPASGRKVYLEKDSELLLDAINGLLEEAEKAGLYVMPLIQTPTRSNDINAFTEQLLRRFNDRPIVFAYDFLNEPLYDDDSGAERKADVAHITRKWRVMMDRLAPHQLLTIGLSEPIEVLIWDPAVMHVDFLAFHTYHPLRVPNEIYWYAKHSTKPWMIGETGLPADGDSVSYEEQRQFMVESFDRTVDCGGLGYGWWEFQDVPLSYFEGAYTGILHRAGTLECPNGYVMQNTGLKPVAMQAAELQLTDVPERGCPCWTNYHNQLGYENYRISGVVLDDDTDTPIEGAVVRAWNEDWGIGVTTFTDKQGHYTLYSNDSLRHIWASAAGYRTDRSYRDFPTFHTPCHDTAPPHDQLSARHLAYDHISYRDFLAADSIPDSIPGRLFLHDFDPKHFDNAVYCFEQPAFRLQPID